MNPTLTLVPGVAGTKGRPKGTSALHVPYHATSMSRPKRKGPAVSEPLDL